jgi:hypothetical protein
VADADDKLGRELAEVAREFLLWLKTNELPKIPGLKGTPPSHFELYAGVYRRAAWLRGLPFERKLPPGLGMGSPDDQKRFAGLGIGATHLLLVSHPETDAIAPDGTPVRRNRIVADGKVPLEQAGALVTVRPVLDSLKADQTTIGSTIAFDFSSVQHRADLVWDDADEGRRSAVGYPFIFGYETPRHAWTAAVKDLPIPAEIQPRPSTNGYAQLLARRVLAYREDLYHHATYSNRKRAAEDGGAYYAKWKEDEPFRPAQRRFGVAALSDQYLKECFFEFVMKRDDNVLMIELGGMRHLYQLMWETSLRNGGQPVFTVRPLVSIGDTPPVPTRLKRKGAGDDDDSGKGDGDLRFPVRAVVFRAIDGGAHLPQLRYGNLEYPGGLPKRFAVDYKAFVRYYYGDQRVDPGSDDDWFHSFVETFFADASYVVTVEGFKVRVDRDALFLDALRNEAKQSGGPIGERLNELVAWCENETKGQRFVFTKGMRFGSDEQPRELIGVSLTSDVYEWHPQTGLVTRMALLDWLDDFDKGMIFKEVYRSTAGMLPFITVITWGGAIVMGGAVLGVGAPLAQLARTTVRQLGSMVGGKLIAKKIARDAAPNLIAVVVEGVMSLMPKSDDKYYQFLRGIVEGFGTGAVDHYLSEIDDRLVKAAKLVPEIAANIATRGGYHAYMLYRKVSHAVARVTEVVKALRLVLTDKRAALVADQLGRLGQYVGIAFLVILFVIVYLDFAMTHETSKLDKWVDKQRKALQYMVRETGAQFSAYIDDLRADIARLRANGVEPTPDVLHAHDEKLAALVTGTLAKGAREVAGVADLLVLLLREMGIKDLDDLQRKSFTDLMAGGFAALPMSGLVPDIAHKLGAVLGEFVGTIMLERRIVPKGVSENAKGFYNRSPSKAVQTALAGGTWRALWRSVLHPFMDLTNLPDAMKRSFEASQSGQPSAFTKGQHAKTAYHDLLRDLIGDDDELAHRLLRLIDDEGLKLRFDTMVTSAAADALPPAVGDLLKGDNLHWPSDAVMFILYSWMRIGLRQVLQAFEMLEDDKPYAGKFKLAELIDIMGLDVSLDDKTLERLRAVLTRQKSA